MRLELVPLLLLLTACSSIPLEERYLALDGEGKASFLAYYPLLTPRQRDSWLDTANGERTGKMKAWEDENADLHGLLKKFPRDPAKIASYVPSSLAIESPAPDPILAGDSLELRAKLTYRDGSATDATEDVRWKVQPALASLSRNRLSFGCVSSDVEVAADFIGERSGSRVFHFRKPLRELHLDISDRWKGINESQELQLKAQARCQDGSSNDVSCQADWRMEPVEGVELHACGRLVVKGGHSGKILVIQSEYGGKSGVFRLRLP